MVLPIIKPIIVTLTSFNVTGSVFWSKRTSYRKIFHQKPYNKKVVKNELAT